MRSRPAVLLLLSVALLFVPDATADHPPSPLPCPNLDGPAAPILGFYPGDAVNDLFCGKHTVIPGP